MDIGCGQWTLVIDDNNHRLIFPIFPLAMFPLSGKRDFHFRIRQVPLHYGPEQKKNTAKIVILSFTSEGVSEQASKQVSVANWQGGARK